MRNQKVELLAPAGSFEALKAAVQNGADAIYLGGSMFGARAFANNFDAEEMKEAVAYAHIYGVRVFVTVNTLLFEEEIETALQYVEELQNADVDALILQDIGLFTLIRERFPDMELHASTQMHIHNPQGIALLKEAGAARVVLPRETPIEQIEAYAKLGVDLEVFVQGALCVSYSGQCLMSAKTLSRSGNRGECAQSCRMRYTLTKEENGITTTIPTKGEYLLSPKDLNTLSYVPQLIEAGIMSFKIEGRMKRPEYVACMVSFYRQAIDAYLQGKSFQVSKQMEEDMQKIFHRGFTCGHLFHANGSALMNPKRPNHMGVELGIVEKITKDKMYIRLSTDLYQGDGVRVLRSREDEGFRVNKIYNERGLLVNMGKANECIQLDKTMYVEKGSHLVKTSDVKQLEKLRSSYIKENRKVIIEGSFQMKIGEHPILRIKEPYGNEIEITSDKVCERALKTPLSTQRIQEQIEKTGDTPFVFSSLHLDCDAQGIFPIKELNQMRRRALEQCIDIRKVSHANRRIQEITYPKLEIIEHNKLMVVFHTMEQYLAYEECNLEGIPHLIYIDNEVLYQTLIRQGKNVYKREPRVQKEMNSTQADTQLIQEMGGLYQTTHVIADTSLNITNAHAAAFAFQKGAQIVIVSLEQDKQSIKKMMTSFTSRYHQKGNFAVQLYGYIEMMMSEYCPINASCKDNQKQNCGLCRGKARYSLTDIKGHAYPILSDEHCRMHLLSEEAYNQIHELQAYQKMGISSFLCVFTIEQKQDVKRILQDIQRVYHG